jgi:predicted amidophosphoribosyltransferase
MKNLAELLFPTRCISCSRLGLSLCADCRKSWQLDLNISEINTLFGAYPVFSALPYSEVAAKVILSAKESNYAVADNLIVEALSYSLRLFRSQHGSGMLVPIPSRKAAIRRRGRNFLVDISEKVALDNFLNLTPLLLHKRKVRDQSKLNQVERRRNISQALSANSAEKPCDVDGNIEPIILVDDLITTGSTLAEAVRALRSEGYEVKGAVTCAFAQPLR